VLVATRPVDFRKGMDGLAALAKETLGQDPFSGTILVFRAKRADRVKLLLWDGTGLMLVSKRLEQGGFKWPPIMDGVMRLSPAQLAALVEGLDWTPCMCRACCDRKRRSEGLRILILIVVLTLIVARRSWCDRAVTS
jgi:transposase